MDDGVDDKSGHLIIERGYSEYSEIMIGLSTEVQHREMGGGERDNPVLMDRARTRKFRRNGTQIIELTNECRYGEDIEGGERVYFDVSDIVEQQKFCKLTQLDIEKEIIVEDSNRIRSSDEKHREDEGGGERDNSAPPDTAAQQMNLRQEIQLAGMTLVAVM